jgi:hypothetical protein
LEDICRAMACASGSNYEESFRRYLLGQASFPESARLMIWLCAEPDPPIVVIFPDTRRGHGYHAHRFLVPRLCFHMLVGRILPPDVEPIWGENAAEIPIIAHSRRDSGVHQDAFETFAKQAKRLIGVRWRGHDFVTPPTSRF